MGERESLVESVGEPAVVAMESLGQTFESGGEAAPEPNPVVEGSPVVDVTPEPVAAEKSKEDAPKPEAAKEKALEPDGIEAALVAARRMNLPDAVLETWRKENPKEFLAWAEKRSKAQQKTDEDYADLHRLRSQAKPDPAQPPPTPVQGGDSQPESGDQPSGAQADSEAPTPQVGDQQVAEELAGMLGLSTEDARKVQDLLLRAKNQDADSRIEALTEQLAFTREQTAQVAEMARQQQISTARSQLEPEFPGLADQERYAKVHKRTADLIARGVFETHQVSEAMEMACQTEFWEDMQAALGAKGQGPKTTDQPETSSGGGGTLSSKRDPGELAMHYLMQGKSSEEAAALVAKARR